MLNYKTTLILFIAVLSVLSFAYFTSQISLWWVLPAIFAFMAATGWGSYRVDSGFYLKTICKGDDQKKIAITFDDGPHGTVTPALLDLLKSRGVEATFFVIGSRISGNETVLKRIAAENHLIGNHTFSHVPLQPFWSWKKLKTDLEKTENQIFETTAISTRIFRPPFGVTSPPYAKALKKLGLKAIGWSNRSLDTVEKDPVKIFERVRKNLSGGDIILFHDTDEKILTVIELLLNHLAENGIKVVRLDELIKINPYA